MANLFDEPKGDQLAEPTQSLTRRFSYGPGVFDATTAPGAGDDDLDGFCPNSLWYDATADRLYLCVDSAVGAAVWKELSLAGGPVTLARFHTDAEVYDDTDTVMTHTVAAGLMATNGDIIRGEYAGTCASAAPDEFNAGIGISIGGDVYGAVTPGEVFIGDWNIRYTIVRDSATSHRITTVASYNTQDGLKTVTDYGASDGGIDWTGTEVLGLQLVSGEFGSITARMGWMEYVGQ